MPNTSGAQDRSIAARIREELGFKYIRKYFPDPANKENPNGNVVRFEEIVDESLRWLGEAVPVLLTDTFTIDSNGQIPLDTGPAARIKNVLSLTQNGRIFDKVRSDWSEGVPLAYGNWYIKNRTLYTASFANWNTQRMLYAYEPSLSLYPGEVQVEYFGVPTEAQLENNPRLIRACVDYGLYQAFFSMVPQIIRAKDIKMVGIPEIHDNADDFQASADRYLQKAEMAVGAYAVSSIQR